MSKQSSISCGDALDIMNASKLKSRLEKSLEKSNSIVLKADKVIRADTAGLQLILAFMRHAETLGKVVQWKSPSDNLLKASILLGMSTVLNLAQKIK